MIGEMITGRFKDSRQSVGQAGHRDSLWDRQGIFSRIVMAVWWGRDDWLNQDFCKATDELIKLSLIVLWWDANDG